MEPASSRPIRILGVFAHPDDEVFCAGGTLARYVAAGTEAMVVSFTRGEAGQIRDASRATRRTLGETRTAELHRSCAQLGVQQVRCLDFADGKLQMLPPSTLVGHVTALVREFRPDIVITFDDTGGYGHPDHIAVSRATTAACKAAGNEASFPEQLDSGLMLHSPTRLYHSCFPRNDRTLLRLLVEWLMGLDTRFRGTDEFMHGLMLFADESTMLGYAADHLKVEWYPQGFYIIEQGEPAVSLYLLLSGAVDILIEDETGRRRHIDRHGPGVFLGEIGIAYGTPRAAHVVAAENATCLVLSPGEPTYFAGQGEEASFATHTPSSTASAGVATVGIDVRAFVMQKAAAMAEHRTQYPITPDMLPRSMMEELLGREFFIQILPTPALDTELFPFALPSPPEA